MSHHGVVLILTMAQNKTKTIGLIDGGCLVVLPYLCFHFLGGEVGVRRGLPIGCQLGFEYPFSLDFVCPL